MRNKLYFWFTGIDLNKSDEREKEIKYKIGFNLFNFILWVWVIEFLADVIFNKNLGILNPAVIISCFLYIYLCAKEGVLVPVMFNKTESTKYKIIGIISGSLSGGLAYTIGTDKFRIELLILTMFFSAILGALVTLPFFRQDKNIKEKNEEIIED